jgi:hypothetical protein
MTRPDDPDIWNGARVASPGDEMLRLACLDFEGWHPGLAERARAMLAADPALAHASIHTAAAIGDASYVRVLLDREPALAGTRGGPHGWVPLLYACYARLDLPEHSTFEVARVLLSAGADPNAGFLWHGNVPSMP